jgi:hypothetical protein
VHDVAIGPIYSGTEAVFSELCSSNLINQTSTLIAKAANPLQGIFAPV